MVPGICCRFDGAGRTNSAEVDIVAYLSFSLEMAEGAPDNRRVNRGNWRWEAGVQESSTQEHR